MRVAVIVLCGACAFERGAPGTDEGVTSPTPDAESAPRLFGTPELVSVSSAAHDDDVTLTGDMLEMYFESTRGGGNDIYVSRRTSLDAPWSTPVKVTELSSGYYETSMEVSADGLKIYFASTRPPSNTLDIYVATRTSRSAAWGMPAMVSALSTASAAEYSALERSAIELFFTSDQAMQGDFDVFRARRASTSAAWGTPQRVRGLDTSAYEGEAYPDSTGAIWFTGAEDVTFPGDIFRAEPNGDDSYAAPVRIDELATEFEENDPWLSPDGRTLYFTSNRNSNDGTLDIFMATR